MTTQHTPGPWQCYADLPSTEPNWHIVTNASRMRVLANVHIEPGNAVDEANARLITAAPDMLAALRIAAETLASFDEGDPTTETGWNHDELLDAWKEVVAAIAKATTPCPRSVSGRSCR